MEKTKLNKTKKDIFISNNKMKAYMWWKRARPFQKSCDSVIWMLQKDHIYINTTRDYVFVTMRINYIRIFLLKDLNDEKVVINKECCKTSVTCTLGQKL